MSGLKEIKTRIASVKNTLKITSAMKMVASAKLHKIQAVIGNKLPYEQQLRRILSGLLQSDELREALKNEFGMGGHSPVALQDVGVDEYPSKADIQRVALVAFSSNSSLCGAFNANMVKKFNEAVDTLRDRGYADEDIDVYAVGRKIADAARKAGLELYRDCSEMADKPSYENSSDLANELIDRFTGGDVDQVIFIYGHFASAASQPAIRENYLPLALGDFGAKDAGLTGGQGIPGQARNDVEGRGDMRGRNDVEGRGDMRGRDDVEGWGDVRGRNDVEGRGDVRGRGDVEGWGDVRGWDDVEGRGDVRERYPVDYTLEPDPMALVKALLPKVLLLKMYTVLLDANAAEHAARTMAMQIATDNARDLISELTLAYNKGRQQEITAEILDLVGGTMA